MRSIWKVVTERYGASSDNKKANALVPPTPLSRGEEGMCDIYIYIYRYIYIYIP